MSILYLLTESDADDLFYTACAERITGLQFEPHSLRFRQNAGVDEVRRMLPIMLQKLRSFDPAAGVFFIVGLDNDRSPHPSPEAMVAAERARLTPPEQAKENLHDIVIALMRASFGPDQSAWGVFAALALPVEMLETWILLIALGCNAGDLPRFPHKDKNLAQLFYHPNNVPPQLKDLVWAQTCAAGLNDVQEWWLDLMFERLDPNELAARSRSFEMFMEWLALWPPAAQAVG